jgi:pimeloyl-ACP methyl ester carboxylesterase
VPEPITVPSSDGATVVVHDLGGTDGAPPVLLSHATGFHALVWRPFAAALADRFRLWAVDYRCHGDATPPDTDTVEWSGFEHDVEAALACIGLTDARPFGVGHSMGGAALVLAELAMPGTFRGLYLFEPIIPDRGTIPDGAAEGPGNFMAAAARRRRPTFESRAAALANYASKPPLNGLHPDALAAYVEHGFHDLPDGSVTLACSPEWEARVFEGAGSHDAWDRLGRITCPVTIAAGGEAMGPVRFAQAATERIPGGRFERYDDLDHFAPLAAPARIAEAAAAFFSSCP